MPDVLGDAVTLVGRMSTPLCMVIMGMRLASAPVKDIFIDPLVYISIVVKQFIMPLIGLLLVWFMPIDDGMKIAFYVMCCCPVASVVLNFAEMLGDGQKPAANTVLLSTLTSVLTMPLMLLIVQNL